MGYLKHDPAGNEEALDLLEILHSFLTKLENEAIAEIMQKAEGVKEEEVEVANQLEGPSKRKRSEKVKEEEVEVANQLEGPSKRTRS